MDLDNNVQAGLFNAALSTLYALFDQASTIFSAFISKTEPEKLWLSVLTVVIAFPTAFLIAYGTSEFIAGVTNEILSFFKIETQIDERAVGILLGMCGVHTLRGWLQRAVQMVFKRYSPT